MTQDGVPVFDGERLRATLFPGRSDRLIVTFDYRLAGRSGFMPANHSTGFARQGFSQLVIRTRENDWFVNPETEALEAALARLVRDHGRVQCLGYSMGGYGALRFARALGARQVVVVSPQVSIAPAAAPWDRRYRAEGRRFDPDLGDLAPRAVPALGGLLVFDPFVPADRRHAAAIAALFPALRGVRLGHGGHPATRTLRGANRAWVVQHEAGQRRASAAAILAAHRAARRGSKGWWERLAAHAMARRPALAERALATAAGLRARSGELDEP